MTEYVGSMFEYTDISDRELSQLDHGYSMLRINFMGSAAVDRIEAITTRADDDDDCGFILHGHLTELLADYVYKAFGIPTEAAQSLVEAMESSNILPTVEQCQKNPRDAITRMRFATFDALLPMASSMLPSEQLGAWLSDIVRVVLPPSEGHGESCIQGESGCISIHCPARALVDTVERLIYVDRAVQDNCLIDQERTFENLQLLLATLQTRGLLDNDTRHQWETDASSLYQSEIELGRDGGSL